MPKKDDGNLLLVGAGILSMILGVGATLFMNQPKKSNGGSSMTSQPKKAGCGCGKH